MWDPVQVATWLGIVWNGAQGVISITEIRVENSLSHIGRILLNHVLSARDLASLAGQLFP